MEEQIKELKEVLEKASLLIRSIERDAWDSISGRDSIIEEQRLIIESRNNTISSLIDKIRLLEEKTVEVPEEKCSSTEVLENLTVSDELFAEVPEDANSSIKNPTDVHSLYVIDSTSMAWMSDKPGPYIEDIRDAITFNDRLLYINELFDGNVAVYEEIVNRINGLSSMVEVVAYLREEFPHWDEYSDTVYRLYMTVRRRF